MQHVDILYEHTKGGNGAQMARWTKNIFNTSNRQDLGAKIPGKIPSLPHAFAKNSLSSYTSRQSSYQQNPLNPAPLPECRG
jgi:hypothetical protein